MRPGRDPQMGVSTTKRSDENTQSNHNLPRMAPGPKFSRIQNSVSWVHCPHFECSTGTRGSGLPRGRYRLENLTPPQKPLSDSTGEGAGTAGCFLTADGLCKGPGAGERCSFKELTSDRYGWRIARTWWGVGARSTGGWILD